MDMRTHLVALALLAMLALPAMCTASSDSVKTLVYQGTLGTQPIVMKLPAEPAKAKFFEASYFFPRYGIDQFLDVVATDKGHIQMVASGRDLPSWDLTRLADGDWKGTWKSAEGRSLPVFLRNAVLAPPSADVSDFFKRAFEQKPYVYLRLRNIKLELDRRQSFMGYTLQWWRDPRSHIALFTVVDGYSTESRQRINQALTSELWNQVEGYYSCVGSSPMGGSFDFSATPTLLTSSIVSIKTTVDFYCGGAHGDTGYAGINLDARTGQKLALGDVMELDHNQPLQDVLAPWLRTQLIALYPDHMRDDCGYDQPDGQPWGWADWYLTAKGMFFIPYFSHVVAACTYSDDWSLLPWDWLNKNGAQLKLPLPGITPPGHQESTKTNTAGDPPQFRGITLDEGEQQVFMGLPLQWWREPESGLKMFQIVRNGQTQDSFVRTNNTLMQLLWQQLGHYYACQYSVHAKPVVSVRPTFANSSVVSADVSVSQVDTFINHIETAYGCDDANDIRSPITIDVRNGKILSPSDIFRVAPDASPNLADREMADWLIKQLTSLYPDRMSGIEPTCNFANPDIWVEAKYFLTPTGIFFYPDFSRSSQSPYVCAASDDWSELPWALFSTSGASLVLPNFQPPQSN